MKKNLYFFFVLFISSCSIITGENGYFPDKSSDFLKDKKTDDLRIPEGIDSPNYEDYYPIEDNFELPDGADIPKPRQIFSTSGDATVQLRRLGDLMWIYVETLPSSAWPISKSFWDSSGLAIESINPTKGEIKIIYDDDFYLVYRVEHGIKEASSEIFLNKVNKDSQEIIYDPDLIKEILEELLQFFADSSDLFSGTSLAAQNLNDIKKVRIYTKNGLTIIELDLSFDRAWSSVSRAIKAANINIVDVDRKNGKFYLNDNVDRPRFFLFRSGSRNNDDILGDYEYVVSITEENKKTYVSGSSISDNIENLEILISKINEQLN